MGIADRRRSPVNSTPSSSAARRRSVLTRHVRTSSLADVPRKKPSFVSLLPTSIARRPAPVPAAGVRALSTADVEQGVPEAAREFPLPGAAERHAPALAEQHDDVVFARAEPHALARYVVHGDRVEVLRAQLRARV